MRSWLTLFVLCAACSLARERPPDAGPLPDVAGADGIVDVDPSTDAGAAPFYCPARGPAFTFATAGSFEVGGRLEWLTMGGDGEFVYALVRAGERHFAVLRLDPRGLSTVEVMAYDGFNGDMTVDDGAARVVLQDRESTLHVFGPVGDALVELGTTRAARSAGASARASGARPRRGRS